MGIDKLRIKSDEPICPEFCERVNQDIEHASKDRQSRVLDVSLRDSEAHFIDLDSKCWISTRKKRFKIPFYLQLNFVPCPGRGPSQILELNPNKLRNGLADLTFLTDWIWGGVAGDFKISRIDLNADLELPVDGFFRTLRVPYKRKSARYAESSDRKICVHGNCGVTGFQIGASPSLIRVYDKREELRRRREDISQLPQTLTRFEWELRYAKCPIQYLSQLPELLDIQPFEKLEFREGTRGYDFRGEPQRSRVQFLYDHLREKYGGHEATRILNRGRHFARDCAPFLPINEEPKEKLQESYLIGVNRFLDNKPGDPFFPID